MCSINNDMETFEQIQEGMFLLLFCKIMSYCTLFVICLMTIYGNVLYMNSMWTLMFAFDIHQEEEISEVRECDGASRSRPDES